MYLINRIVNSEKNREFILIENPSKTSYAKIQLKQGASIQELKINNYELIKDMHPLTYPITYASAILFPFANRIKDGSYIFEGERHQLEINEKKLNNAIHGLVYNKTFEVVYKEATETSSTLKLVYHEKEKNRGFPFTYSIYLEYILTNNGLDLNVEIKNTDSKKFPFTVGWHPYFYSKDLVNSYITFKSNRKIELDEQNIAIGSSYFDNNNSFKIGDQFLDDCFKLQSKTVLFLTPSYKLQLKTSEEDSFLQLYTPPLKNSIAIEPTTGVSNSFNNAIGVKVLHPNESYNINWNLKIEDN